MWPDSLLATLVTAPMDPHLLLLEELQGTQATSCTMRASSSSPIREDTIFGQILTQPCHASESLNGDAIAGTFFAKLGLHSCGTSVRDKGLLVRLLLGSGRPLHVCSALASFGCRPRRSILHGKLRHGNGKFKTALKQSERPTARSTWLQQAEDMQEINGRSKLEACKNGKKTASTDSFFFHTENFTLTASLKTF